MIDIVFMPELKKQLEAPKSKICDISLPIRFFDLLIKQSYTVILWIFVEGWITPADIVSNIILIPEIWDA